MTKFLKIIIPIWCLCSTYWYVCELHDNGCGCILAQAPKEHSPLDSLGKISLTYLQQQDTMHFYFANKTIEFYADSSVLSYLQHLKIYLPQIATQKVTLYGYSDPKGNAKDNAQLAKQRLETIYQSLLKLGISPTQIDTISKGEIGHCTDNDEFCLKKYRRVDAILNN